MQESLRSALVFAIIVKPYIVAVLPPGKQCHSMSMFKPNNKQTKVSSTRKLIQNQSHQSMETDSGFYLFVYLTAQVHLGSSFDRIGRTCNSIMASILSP